MRIHFINDNDINAMFFPDTMNFYEVNDFTKDLVLRLNNGQSNTTIADETGASIESIEAVEKLLKQNDHFVKQVYCPNEKILGKLVLNVTNKCNLGCKYCYAGGGSYCSKESIMDEDFALEILEKFYNEYDEIKVIQLFGGEPTLNLNAIKRVCEYIDDRYKKGLIKEKPIMGMVTNGTIVNDFLVDLIKSYDLKVTVSLDGPPIVNDKMRVYKNGEKTSSRVIDNIKFLKSQTSEPSTIESTYNIHHIKEEVKVMDVASFMNKELNIDSVHIVPASGDDTCDFVLKNREPFIDSVNDVFKGIENGEKVSYSLVNRVISSLKRKKTTKYLCEAGISMYSVSTKGDVYPCFMFTETEEHKLGNIKDDDLFESENFKAKREKLKSFSKFKEEACKDCFNNTICTGCLGLNSIETGDIHKPSSLNCDMNKKITERVILGIIRNKKKCKS